MTKEVLPAIRKTGAYAGLVPSEEQEVTTVSQHLMAAIAEKLAGKMNNADASVLVNLTSQYLRAWDVRLRLRAGRAPRGEEGVAA